MNLTVLDGFILLPLLPPLPRALGLPVLFLGPILGVLVMEEHTQVGKRALPAVLRFRVLALSRAVMVGAPCGTHRGSDMRPCFA